MVDKAEPLKFKDLTGIQSSDYRVQQKFETNDYANVKGVALGGNDDNRIYDDSGEMKFEDQVASTPGVWTLANLRPAAAGAYGPFSPWSAKAGFSDVVPLETTEFETDSTMHDATVDESGTATGTHSTTTLQDTSQSWTTNEFANYIIKLTGGTGSGQWRLVSSNTADTITVSSAWDTTPDNTSTYEITLKQSRLTAPLAGIYRVTAHCSFGNGNGVYGVAILKNGSFGSIEYRHENAATEFHVESNRMFNLAKDDYIEMKVYNGNGSALSLFGGSLRLYLQMEKV